MNIKFKLPNNNNNCIKQVGPIEHFSASIFSRGALVFNGSIDTNRFIKAMEDSFKDFQFMLTTLFKDENDVICIKGLDGDSTELLELEDRKDDSIDNVQLDNLLPNKIVNIGQQMGYSQGYTKNDWVPEFKMCAFKLTVFNGYFSIGYNINHSIFDQGAIVYYLKYLSHLYTYNGNTMDESFKLKKPQLVDIQSLGFEIPEFKTIDEAREYGNNSLGYVYKPINLSAPPPTQPVSNPKSLYQIKFNLNEIDKLKSTYSGSQFVSRNDIMSSIIMKIYNLNSSDDNFIFGYVSNIRKHLGIGEEGISNLIHQCRMTLKVQDIKEKTVLELASLVRKSVSEISKEDFLKFASWCKALKDNNQRMIEYFNLPETNMIRTSNWTNFDYDNIKFDTSSPVSLMHYQAAQWGINIISFNTKDSIKYYTTQIYIPSYDLNQLEQFSKDSKLFTIDQHYNLK